MREIKKSDTYIDVYDSINELCKYLERPRKDGRDNSSETGGYSDTHTYTYEEAVNLFKYTDTKLYEEIIKQKKKINVEKLLGNVIKRKSYKNDIVGFQPNVPAYLTGIPQNMINEINNRTSNKIINIFLNTRVSWMVSSDEMERAGTLYVILLDLLEKAGYRVNLYVGSANSIGSRSQLMILKIKTDKEPLNLKKMCFPVAHPSFLRRIKWRWMEVADTDWDPTDGYGGPLEYDEIKKCVKEAINEDCLVFNYEDTNCNVSEEVVLNILKQSGIELEMENK